MSEVEVGTLIIEQVALAHSFGEAVWGRIDRWISVSFGLILLGYFAPERLRPGITALIVGLYVLFSVHVALNANSDMELAGAVLKDAQSLAMTQGIKLDIFAAYGEPGNLGYLSMGIFLVGLFLGTVGFLISACVTTYRNRVSDTSGDG
jgi:hypothetical protein